MDDTAAECQTILSRLYLYLDGEIAKVDRVEVDRHLERCAECARHFGFERELKQLVQRKCLEGGIPPQVLESLNLKLGDLADRG